MTIRADAEHTTPLAVSERFQRRFLDLFVQLGISFDLFTSTHTENHFKVSQDMFLGLQRHGYLYREKQQMLYSETAKRFLPDRYVEGECYICHYAEARGDQCDNCGNVLDAVQLISPRSRIDGSRPVVRETEHYFLDYGKLAPAIQDYLSQGKDLARECAVLHPQHRRRAARPPHHARPRLGHSGTDRRLGGEVPVRMVRSGHRLSL